MTRYFGLSAALAVVLLSGCEAGTTPPTATPKPESQRMKVETAKATCMKQRGFRYVPWIPKLPDPSPQEVRAGNGDHLAMLDQRQRYGFGIYSGYALPDNPDAGGRKFGVDSPNNRYTAKMSQTQAQAFVEAEDACFVKVAKDVLGKTVTSPGDFWDQYTRTREAVAARELDGDTRLVELAQAYGDCMKAKGYPVASVRPSVIVTQARDQVQEQFFDLGARQNGEPATEHESDYGKSIPDLTPAEAAPYLAKEVRVALDDLSCGKSFFPLYFPQQRRIQGRISAEFGLD
ncbi:hypothetical protein OIE66_01905 [Nonomuraea sp. NBC_01738]|uniref:hypothetical protein n=1 Tax=Nonomuraea sp. NBC_01738 TaxID=2976003 RepID=UPI002E116EB2|nr:hypothetical protein OIE66_01905 [Nonomuraea sp. NBC_01738]